MSFVIENQVLKKYTGDDKAVIIPDGVTEIGNFAFSDCNEILSVTISSSVTHIAENAFYGCSSLKVVNIMGELRKLALNGFTNCNNITDVTVNGRYADTIKKLILASAVNITEYSCAKCRHRTLCYLLGANVGCTKHGSIYIYNTKEQRWFSFTQESSYTIYAEHDSGADGYEKESTTWKLPLPDGMDDDEALFYFLSNLDKLEKSTDSDYRPAFG